MVDVLYIFMIALGLFGIFRPELLWKIDHFTSVKNGEPTQFYLIMSRIVGILCVLTGVVLMIVRIIDLY